MNRLHTLVTALRAALGGERTIAISTRAVGQMAAALLVIGLVVGVRLYRLEQVPAEWFGDISTVYEYAMASRNFDFPRGLYILGVGPLYPLALGPMLAVLGTSYWSVKLVAVLWSLVALAALFVLCRRLLGRAYATLALVIAGTGSWLLIYSRLGDVEAAVPTIAMVALAIAVGIVQSPSKSALPPILCGVVTGASLYLYGATFAVPILVTAVLVISPFVIGPPRYALRHLLFYGAALLLTLGPLLAQLAEPDVRAHNHFATRFIRGDDALPRIANNYRLAMSAYVTHGDANVRGNPRSLPHVDRLSLGLAVVGCVFWLMPRRWRWGWVLVGGFFLMHVPVALAHEPATNAARTIGAAPFLYILVASGVWWLASAAARLGRAAGVVVALALVVPIVVINVHRVFVLYAHGLPYDNTPIARVITTYADLLPPSTGIYLVGSTWAPGFMPEPKSIEHTMRRPESFHEETVEAFDCTRLAQLPRPAVLIWSFREPVPSPRLNGCEGKIAAQLFTNDGGLPLFHSAWLAADAVEGASSGASASLGSTALAAPPPPPQPPPSPLLESAAIQLGGETVEMRYQPLDTGHPNDAIDGDLGTVMRGAHDNPYIFELHYAQPTRVTGWRLSIGFMPEYRVNAVVQVENGSDVEVTVDRKPDPGIPVVELQLPGGPAVATSARITVTDIRQTPAEGWHFHLFELEQR